MLPYDALLGFVTLYICAKLMEHGFPFYGAAGMFVLLSALGDGLMAGLSFERVTLLNVVLQLALALPIFYLLDKYEEAIAAWTTTFAAGFIILIVIL